MYVPTCLYMKQMFKYALYRLGIYPTFAFIFKQKKKKILNELNNKKKTLLFCLPKISFRQTLRK